MSTMCLEVDATFSAVQWWSLVLSKRLKSKYERDVVLKYRIVLEVKLTSIVIRVRNESHVW